MTTRRESSTSTPRPSTRRRCARRRITSTVIQRRRPSTIILTTRITSFKLWSRELEGAEGVLVVGPSTAKLQFIRYAFKHDRTLEPRIVGVETVDHPTDGQLVAYSKRYFAADRVRGVAAMSTMPMYLNTRTDHLRRLDDIQESDKIAVTAVKVSIPAIIMQMYSEQKYGIAHAFKFDRYTVSMTHPDGVIAMLSDNKQITAHYTSPPFHQRERKESTIRTIQY